MIFAHFRTEVNEANMFLLACARTRETILVDAPVFDARVSGFLRERALSLVSIFITHLHYDHIGGLPEYVYAYSPRIYAAADSVSGLPAVRVRHGDVIKTGELEFRVVALPGHTPESVGLVAPGMVFTGDALFAGSIGGVSDATSKELEIRQIREHIFTLPDAYHLHTGHGPSSTVWIEKHHNPFFV